MQPFQKEHNDHQSILITHHVRRYWGAPGNCSGTPSREGTVVISLGNDSDVLFHRESPANRAGPAFADSMTPDSLPLEAGIGMLWF